ncbi:MAG: cyclic nucleotide-binding domain-containing protein [Desulfatibacillaceae bacterium]
MIVKQSDLFKGMDPELIKQIMDLTKWKHYERNEVVFERGEAARNAFLLITGTVRLNIDQGRHVVYTVNNGGELFGWSALMGRDEYSATATCIEETKLASLDIEGLRAVLERDPWAGMTFYRRIAKLMGERLITSYEVISNLIGGEKKRSRTREAQASTA